MKEQFMRIKVKTMSLSLIGCAAIAMTLSFSACTTTRSDENVRLETARAIGGITSDQVKITNLHIGFKIATWEAETPKGHYKCESDDMLERPAICVKQP
jgi:hypothetical protein